MMNVACQNSQPSDIVLFTWKCLAVSILEAGF